VPFQLSMDAIKCPATDSLVVFLLSSLASVGIHLPRLKEKDAAVFPKQAILDSGDKR